MDLDSGIATGTGTRLPGDYSPDLHFSNVDGVTMISWDRWGVIPVPVSS